MSRKNLEGLLDAMLEDSADDLAEQRALEAEARAAKERAAQVEALRERTKAKPEAPAFEDVAQLTGLTEPDLQKVLGKAAPDDLLVVLATAGDVLQRRILAHMDEVRDAERDASNAKVVKVANALLREGEIGLPEPESEGAAEAPRAQEKALRDLLTDLVRIAEQAGSEALSEVAASAGEPLLREGLRLVGEGTSGDALRAELASVRSSLEARYAERLKMMEEAVVAIGAGEKADTFRARLFEDG